MASPSLKMTATSTSFSEVQDKIQAEMKKPSSKSESALAYRTFKVLKTVCETSAQDFAKSTLLQQAAKIDTLFNDFKAAQEPQTVSLQLISAETRAGLQDSLSTLNIGLQQGEFSPEAIEHTDDFHRAVSHYQSSNDYKRLTLLTSAGSSAIKQALIQTALRDEIARTRLFIAEFFQNAPDKEIDFETALLLDNILKTLGFQLIGISPPALETPAFPETKAPDTKSFELLKVMARNLQDNDSRFNAETPLDDKAFSDALFDTPIRSINYCTLEDDSIDLRKLTEEKCPASQDALSEAYVEALSEGRNSNEAYIELALQLTAFKQLDSLGPVRPLNELEFKQVNLAVLALTQLAREFTAGVTTYASSLKPNPSESISINIFGDEKIISVRDTYQSVLAALENRILAIINEFTNDGVTNFQLEAFSEKYKETRHVPLQAYVALLLTGGENQESLQERHRLISTQVKDAEAHKDIPHTDRGFLSAHRTGIKRTVIGTTLAVAGLAATYLPLFMSGNSTWFDPAYNLSF